jgi:hypothetical protein
MISSHLTHFAGKPVVDFDPDEPLVPEDNAYRVRLGWEDYDTGRTLVEVIEELVAAEGSDQIDALVIGCHSFEMDSTAPVAEALIEHRQHFSKLRALFFGDITYEESEISWIEQTDQGPLLDAYDQLEAFAVRGGNWLRFSNLSHDLRSLVVQSGGLAPSTIADLVSAKLPNVEDFEVWLGSSYYGFQSSVDEFEALFEGEGFPKLKRLGLMNAEITDELVAELAEAPILAQLEHLDLSMGTLTDEGAKILADSPGFAELKALIARHHFVEESEHFEALSAKGVTVHEHKAEPGYDDEPYCQVSE